VSTWDQLAVASFPGDAMLCVNPQPALDETVAALSMARYEWAGWRVQVNASASGH
jgi:hypothetical protein